MTDCPDHSKPLAMLACLPEGDAAALLGRLPHSQIKQLARQLPEQLTIDCTLPIEIVAELSRGQSANGSAQAELTEIDSKEYLAKSDPVALAKLLADELPQTVAEIVKLLPPAKAAATLTRLSTRMQLAVTQRIAHSRPVESDAILDLCLSLARQGQTHGSRPLVPRPGAVTVARLLDRLNSKTERALTENLAHEDPKLLDQIQDLRKLLRAIRHRRFSDSGVLPEAA